MENGGDNLEAGGERCHVTCRGRDSQFVEDFPFPGEPRGRVLR